MFKKIKIWELDKCPYSELAVNSKPGWQNLTFDTDNFKVTLAAIGKTIIYSKLWGATTFSTIHKYINMLESVVYEAVERRKPFVLIEDYSELSGISARAARYFINYHKKNIRLKALIFNNPNYLLKIEDKILKQLKSAKFSLAIAQDYEESIEKALHFSQEKQRKSKGENVNVIQSKEALETILSQSKCPITGFPVVTREDFMEHTICESLKVTYKIIGGCILHTSLNGPLQKTHIQHFWEERYEFLKSVNVYGNKYIEIIDGTKLTIPIGESELIALKEFIHDSFYLGNLLGCIIYPNASIHTNAKALLEKNLSAEKTLRLVENYSEAVLLAIKILNKNAIVLQAEIVQRFTKNDWYYSSPNCSAKFELVRGDIAFLSIKNVPEVADIGAIFELFEKMLDESGISNKHHFFIALDMSKTKRFRWSAINKLGEGFRKINAQIKCKQVAIYGASAQVLTQLILLRNQLNIAFSFVASFDEAIKSIDDELITENNYSLFVSQNASTDIEDIYTTLCDTKGEFSHDLFNNRSLNKFNKAEIISSSIEILKNELKELSAKLKSSEKAICTQDKHKAICNFLWEISLNDNKSVEKKLHICFEKMGKEFGFSAISLYRHEKQGNTLLLGSWDKNNEKELDNAIVCNIVNKFYKAKEMVIISKENTARNTPKYELLKSMQANLLAFVFRKAPKSKASLLYVFKRKNKARNELCNKKDALAIAEMTQICSTILE
ncbi:MAG: hypothetical protein CSA05_00530 [Bacteroidia bacterium]|nr:MAG: hypothetical protein CSB01_00180 [Bacteroidia bacterium]PIE86433.1 MAG: hypothetical protein CSA05_00530 [Bacteroidia bacterium]